MDTIVQNIIPYLLIYKYVTVFVISFIAAFILPIPSGSILMAASSFSRLDFLQLHWIIIVSIIGNIVGDNLGYLVARRYGEDILSKIGFRRILNSKTLKNIEKRFNQYPGFIIFISRFEVLSTLSVNLLSGISKTNYKKYFIHEAIGTVLQVLFYALVGYLFASSWEYVNTTIGRVMAIIGIFVILFLFSLGRKSLIKNKVAD